MLDNSGLVKSYYNAKTTEIKAEIPNIAGLATISALHAVKNKIAIVSGLFKKTDYDAKISDIEAKYFTTSDYNTITSEILD